MRLFFLIGIIVSMKISALNIVSVEESGSEKFLKKNTKEVKFPLSNENIELIKLMKDKLYELGGVGLAAPQVKNNKSIIVIYIPKEASLLRENVIEYPMHVMFNASYIPEENAQVEYDFEGCYSVSSKMGKVPRYKKIKLKYQDEQGKWHFSVESGFYARVLQHEIDHLNSILIIDRLTSDCVQGSIKEMMRLRREELPEDKKQLFDEIVARKFKSKS